MNATSPVRGLPVWYEILTPDAAACRRFYTALFDWKEVPWASGAGEYLMFAVGERPICGLDDRSVKPGEPARWVTYFSVDDVDATLAANEAAGGATLAGPDDVPEVGRMAACTDPQGAVWCPFRPSNAPAVQDTASRAPGDFIWVELLSKQPEDAALHYADLLGYTVETMDMGAMGLYRVLKVGEVGIGGVMPMPPDAAAPPQWLPYVRAVDVDATAARAQSLGARVELPPTDIGDVGRVAARVLGGPVTVCGVGPLIDADLV